MSKLKDALKKKPWLVEAYHKALWQRHKVSDWAATHVFTGSRTIETPHGFSLVAGRFIANKLMQDGSFEAEEVAIASECLKEIDVFVDIGANVGYYTCLAGKAGRPVVAFEPQPRNLAWLYQNIRANRLRDIEVFPIALGAEVGLADLFGSSGPSASLLKDWAGYSSGYHQTVPVNRLDAIVADRLRGRRLLIKIDVEGFEYSVLQGARAVIASDPKPIWLMEICLNEFHPGGTNPKFEQTFALFFDAGYRVFTADARRTEVTRTDIAQWCRDNRSPLGTFNYLMRA